MEVGITLAEVLVMIAIFPEIAGCAEQRDFEKLAVLVRKYFGAETTYRPIVDVEAVFEGVGIPIQEMTLDCLGAMVGKDLKGSFQIACLVGRGDLDAAERRFLLAHMLGHYFLHLQPLIARGEMSALGFREEDSPLKRFTLGSGFQSQTDKDYQKELEADRFAVSLLLPLGMVKRAATKFATPDEMAPFFGVTPVLIHERLSQLGLTESKPHNFLDAETAISSSTTSVEASKGAEELDLRKIKAPAVKSPIGRKAGYKIPKKSYEGVNVQISKETLPIKNQEKSVKVSGSSKRGMARIREIARLLEERKKGIDPT